MRHSALILTLTFLSGCAVTNPNISGEWDCPAQQGRACTTIGESDNLSGSSAFTPAAVSVATLPPVASTKQTPPVSLIPEAEGVETAAPLIKTSKIRQAEILGKVWFYPFVDAGKHYHEGAFIHVILRPSDWKTDPAHLFPISNAIPNGDFTPSGGTTPLGGSTK